jgi:FecR protein
MEHRTELLRLLSSLCDEQITEAEQARLEELLADGEARRLYVQYLDMHARLLTHSDEAGTDKLHGIDALAGLMGETAANARVRPPATPVSTRNRWRRIRRLVSYAAVAAATVAATILVQLMLSQPRMPAENAQSPPLSYVATLSQAAKVEWGAATQAYRPGSRVLAGELELKSGVARLAYDGGIELIVEGPARLNLESELAATLLSGKVVFRADDASAPFTLSTPSSILVDLGTEYAVEVGATREEVHVFSGEVQRLPKAAAHPGEPELLAAGEARRYRDAVAESGEPADIEPARFVRQLPAASPTGDDPAAALLAYEGFAYADESALRKETAAGGSGFSGSWGAGFARAVNERADDRIALNVSESLVRDSAAASSVGGAFEHEGFAKYFRRLAAPVRMDSDGVYYFSFLFRREGPPLEPLNDVSIQLRETDELERDQSDGTMDRSKRLNFGVDRTNELYMHLERIGRRTPLPLSFGETYLMVAKVAASGAYPDQLFVRVYGPQEPVDSDEPASWSAVGPPIHSDLVFDWLEIHINSHTRQTIDEIRLGTTWAAVATPWVSQE